MKEYLKMSDAFLGKAINNNGEVVVNKYKDVDYGEYVCHAINSHDELVAEVERLKSVLSQCADALYIADRFCGNHTADDCDDSIAIPISDAHLAARKNL